MTLRKDLLLLFIAFSALFLFNLGARPYSAPSEARYIELGRQMSESDDWVTPRINGVKYFEKPPLFYWVQGAQFEAFGWGEFSGRFWTAMGSVFIALLTYLGGRMLYGRAVGLAASGMFATALLPFALSRIVLLDVPVSLFLTATFLAFLAAIRSPRPARWFYAMYAAAALATLTKGLIGILIPGMVIGAWIVLARQWQVLRHARLPTGTLLFLAIAAPWHILAGRATPEFYRFYFIHEHFERFLTKVHGRYHPWWFFIPVLLGGLMPYLFFLPQALKRAWAARGERDTLFLLLWIALPFVFFSLSDSKLIPYVLPLFPPLCILLARYAVAVWNGEGARGFRRGAAALAATLVVASGVFWFAERLFEGKVQAVLQQAGFGEQLLACIALGFALLIAGLLARAKTARPVMVAIFAFAVALNLAGDHVASQPHKDSMKAFAAYLNAHAKPEDEVALLRRYYQDLPVYLNHDVSVIEWTGELDFGRSIEPRTAQWMFAHAADFWPHCAERRLFLITRSDMLGEVHPPDNCPLYTLLDNGTNVLVSNRKEPP
jgi:4-amino-4-deoxy-L-arabinose transferase-like glycosyltransferase